MGKISINQDSLKERREWKRHKINDGSNIFRILPPFGDSEVHNGYPYRKWSYIWLADPVTGKRKPFASPFSSGGDTCPVKEYSDALAEHVDGMISDLKTSGLSDNQIKDDPILVRIRDEQWKLKLSHGYLYNACNQAGEVGILELKATAHKALMKKMSEYIKTYAEDPTSLNSFDDDSGVWFDIRRDGKGKNTEYSATFHQTTEKDEKGRLAKFDDRSALPDNVVENYDDLGYNLHTVYTVKTYDELKELLVINLNMLATNKFNPNPDLLIPGYKQTAPVSAPAKRAPSTVVKALKKPVTLKVDSEDDLPFAIDTKPVKAVAKKTAVNNDDFFAMADDILKD